jgi:uncharacterized iron-regulated membrane protein
VAPQAQRLTIDELHFGRFGGRWNPVAFYGVMVIYVIIGLMPLVLMFTGVLMYWNRSLVKKWRRARAKMNVEPDHARAVLSSANAVAWRSDLPRAWRCRASKDASRTRRSR